MITNTKQSVKISLNFCQTRDNPKSVSEVANPAGAVKVKVHGAFSANLDRPARVRFTVGKAGKPQGCLLASFDFGCRGRCSSGRRLAETYLILMYVSTRGTRDGGLYTCRRSPKTDRLFVRSRSQKPRPFSCRCKRGAKATHPLPPSAAPAGITHYTLQARSCAKGGQRPLWKPPPTSIHQSIYCIIHYVD